jgi:surface antigen
MRIAVLTGVFACAVIFAATSNKVGAATLQSTEANIETISTIERMSAVEETTKSPLLDIVEDEPTVEPATEPVTVEVKKHIVTDNESLSDIAKVHSTTWKRLYDKNTQIENPNIINKGMELVIPEPEEVLEERIFVEPEPVVKSSHASTRSISTTTSTTKAKTTSSVGSTAGNTYYAGYCTWYVKNRRPDIPNRLGNASSWVSNASAQGFATGSTPVVGAVGQQGNHVVYVESVNGDGTVTISDMNYAGWNVVTTRTVSASSFYYIY